MVPTRKVAQIAGSMSRIVTYAHRYKRPPQKRKAVAPEVPAIVTRTKPRKGRASILPGVEIDTPQAKTPPETAETAQNARSAIVTATRRKHVMHAHLVEYLTPEEVQSRGEAADVLGRELVRRATAGKNPSVIQCTDPTG